MTFYGLPAIAEPEATISVRMNRTTKAIPRPGARETVYVEGETYDLPEWLAEAFFRGGEADPAEAHAQPSQDAQNGTEKPGSADEGPQPPRPSGSEKRGKRAK